MALKDLLIALVVSLSVRSGHLEVSYASTAEQSQNETSIDATVMMRREKVVLRPPTNITYFLITSSEAVIGWLPPEIYTDQYDVNTTLIDPPFNETMVWLNHTYPQSLASGDGAKSGSAESSTQANSGNSSEAGVTTSPVFPISKEEFCHSLDYFANYTVDVNVSDEAVKDYVPHLIKLKDVFKPRNVTADIVNNDIVSYSQSCVREYHVFYQKNTSSEVAMVVVNATDRPEVHLKSLTPGTQYTIYVGAVFVSNKMLNSSISNFETAASNEINFECRCDWHGTLQGKSDCNKNISKPCDCRYGYKGLFCEQCAEGFYRTAPYFPCHRCPCASHTTRDATCKFKEGFLTCSQCEVGYTGNICHMCDYGFYRHHKYCVPCHCNNNHNRSKPFMCDVITGACHCMHNASGMNCEMCHSGYVGDALHHRNCTLDESLLSVFSVIPQGVIAGICVGVILVLSFIVGCIVYWRMAKNPPKRPFWTVELKDDHEGVNFNTVPNDDFQIVDPKMTMDDMEFYEQQGGAAQSHGGGKKYARLQENA